MPIVRWCDGSGGVAIESRLLLLLLLFSVLVLLFGVIGDGSLFAGVRPCVSCTPASSPAYLCAIAGPPGGVYCLRSMGLFM